MTPSTDPPTNWSLLATSLPGPETLAELTDSDGALLTPAQLLDAITCTERLLSHVAGLQITLLTEFAKPGRAGDITRIVDTLTDVGSAAHTTDGTLNLDLLDALVTDHAHGMAAAEVAAALNISPITARARVEKAIDLYDGLSATHQALTNGLIDRGRAAVIAEHTDILDPETRSQVEAIVLPLAQGRTAGRLRPLIDRAVIIADPDAADRRVKKEHRGREVTHRPLKDQLSLIKAILPADGAVTVFTLIDLLAGKKIKGDDRLIGERRADALSDLCGELLTHGLVDLRSLLTTPGDTDDSDHFDDLFNDDGLDGDGTTDDFSDPTDSPNGPITSNADWYDDLRSESGVAATEVNKCTCDSGAGAVPDDKPEPDAGQSASTETDQTKSDQTETDRTGTDQTGTDRTEADSSSPAGAIGEAETAAHPTVLPGKTAHPANTAQPHATDSVDASASATSARIGTTSTASLPTDSRQLLRRQGRRPHLTLTMSMSTLMALDRLPGHLDGYGAITAELAEAIMDCAASLNLVIIDPATGQPLHASGRERYRPRQHHRDIAGTMAESCRFPSCRQPVWKCDLDHRKAYDHRHPERGGPTDACNLDPLCRRHHLMKHHSEWSPERLSDGTMKWTSPTNHTYVDPPREVTLPGELLIPTPNPRTSIGLADTEHQSHCTAAGTESEVEPGVLSHSYAIRMFEREALHQRVLQRLANLRRQQIAEMSGSNSDSPRKGAGSPSCPNAETFEKSHPNYGYSDYEETNFEHSTADQVDLDDHPAWTTANIPNSVAELRARSGFTTALADDETPPF